MEVKDACEGLTSFVPACGKMGLQCDTVHEGGPPPKKKRGGENLFIAYEFARNEAIMLRTSVSLSEVSSKPGVSMRTTGRPSNWKASVA